MDVTLAVHPTESTPEGLAALSLVEGNGNRLCHVDLQYSQFGGLPPPNPLALDFLLLASSVYSLDKLVNRDTATDAWTRDIALTVPVSDVQAWNSQRDEIVECLSFLTGDNWSVAFASLKQTVLRPVRRRRRRRRGLLPPFAPDAVSLFSGGLDSLIGVIDWLEQYSPKKLLLVGHHDGDMAGPFSDQKLLRDPIALAYPGRTRALLARVGHAGDEVPSAEITLRGRSLVFVAMGIYAASAYGPKIPLLIPENGTIALNVPLTPSRRGSCSTRTAHPYFLTSLADILSSVGIKNAISNPLEDKTKGEAVTKCLNPPLLEATARLSVSCAKRGHKKHFTHSHAKSCGRCMPCIYRRAALHAIGWDDELYGDDICVGEIDLDAEGERPNDLRACFSFLRRNPAPEELASMLIANGRIDTRRLSDNVAMVRRTMDEIRALIRAKGSADIKRRAGV